MWSFVAQNNYDMILCKTRRVLGLKKALTCTKLSMITKSLINTFSSNLVAPANPYINLYYKYLKKHTWKSYNLLFINNEGLISNNLSKSYSRATVTGLLSVNLATSLASLTTRTILKALNVIKVPIIASTFNGLLWVVYNTLISHYITYPKCAKFSTPYTWVLNSYLFDNLLNKFYYKLYKY